MEKNAKEVAKWMLVPETIEVCTSLLKNKFEGSYLEGFETLISNLKSNTSSIKKPILKNKNWFDRDCVQLKRTYNKEKEKCGSEGVLAEINCSSQDKKYPFSGISLEDWGNPFTPINQVPIHAWEEYFRELYTDPDYVTKESQISLDQTLTGPRLHQERYPESQNTQQLKAQYKALLKEKKSGSEGVLAEINCSSQDKNTSFSGISLEDWEIPLPLLIRYQYMPGKNILESYIQTLTM
ncbi:hypothetical protein E2320_002152 [Naja naja]|nr:hypothetical protein E2320_002152 [Naja naja]